MSLSHRNQSINLLCKSIDWFLCERDIDRERVNNVKYRNVTRLKFGDSFYTSLTKLVLKLKDSICSTIKEIALLYCRKLSVCYHCHGLKYFNNKIRLTETVLVM